VSARSPRVLIIGEFGAGALGLYYARAFETLGWAPMCYDMWAGYTRGGVLAGSRVLRRLLRPALWALMAREAIALAGRGPFDLVLSTKAPFLGRGAVRALRRAAGAPVAMVYPDSPYGAYAMRADVLAVLAEFDRLYIWSRRLLERLHADGVTAAAYLPFAFDPADYGADGPVAQPECGRAHAIAFIGQRYDKREAWLAALRGLDVGVWGLGWARSEAARAGAACVHRAAAHGAAAAAIYRGARVALNVLHADNLPAHNMRTFEIPPCRTMMLTETTEEIEAFFEPERACLTAADPGALRGQAERALADTALTRVVTEGGARAAQPHTYEARSRAIVADVVGTARALVPGAGR
jgi:Glycosyl transferases group 1